MTESGTPIPDVGVDLNGGFDGQSLDTDAEGWARFTNVNAGEATIHTFARGFHDAGRRFVIESDTVTELSVILMRATEATPVVLGTHASPSEDGHTLTVDVDVAVLGEDGLANPTLTAADFAVANSDCAFMWCVMDASGQPLPSGGYYAHVETEVFGWHEASTEPPPTSGTALLLEQSTRSDRVRSGQAPVHGDQCVPRFGDRAGYRLGRELPRHAAGAGADDLRTVHVRRRAVSR